MSSTRNPCISLCKFDDDICLGCGRSKREIKAWKKLDKDDKRTVGEAQDRRSQKEEVTLAFVSDAGCVNRRRGV
ncbi:hypothetical protein A245_27709 [Pseudomonas syringae pv. actinidiae ICMP 19096]|uniref:Fe-S oxidoreductase n=1 Tax=Pseudomonas syringae pv. actinidiae ICMP 19096 TaxID=1194405 RepID=A0A656JSM7_PSESF|nr:hypothetical protein A245_27709 [Pseudomonas syringae pv. actinidiae ICMP 19096]